MTQRPLVRRRRARLDLEAVSDYYFAVAGEAVATDFLAAAERAIAFIHERPGAGSSRGGHPISGLVRGQALARFPYLVLYIEEPDQITVLRVVHQHRDLARIVSTDLT